MRKLNIILGISLLLLSQISLSQVAKKTVVEHFTNTQCSVCASKNPGFYANLNSQANTLHLAIHPSSPYIGCLLYQQNPTANDARTNYYGIYGATPRLVINGNVISPSANYSSSAIFAPYQSLTSPASIRIVQEKFANDSIKSTIVIKTVATNTLGNLSLFVALAEDTVFYTGSNGEPMHFDVFRKSLTNTTGNAITLAPTVGDSVVFTFSSPSNLIWNFSRIYTLAILQETASKNLVQAEAVPAYAGIITKGTVLKSGLSTPIPSANIIFENSVYSYQTVADLNGNFSISSIHPGTYQLTYGKWGFLSKCQSIVIDSLTGNINLNLFTGLQDDFTFNFGWIIASTAKTGKWKRAIPIGTTYATTNDANPGTDVAGDCGKLCFVTGNGGGSYNNDDVDSGYTKLTSPLLNLSTYADPVINFSRWFFASPGSKDTLLVKLNKGSSVVTLEKVFVNSAGNSSWVNKSFRVLDYFTLGTNFKLSFYIKDAGIDHTVEAGVDRFLITENNAFSKNVNKVDGIAGNQHFITSVYPNPFKNDLTVTFSELVSDLKVQLSDVTGRIVLVKTVSNPGKELQVDLSQVELQKGIYFLKLTSSDKTALVKVVKN